jgi:ABC-type phosphate transport system permease subunit
MSWGKKSPRTKMVKNNNSVREQRDIVRQRREDGIPKKMMHFTLDTLATLLKLITGSVMLVAAFTWNDTVRYYYDQNRGIFGNVDSRFAYTIIVSLVAIIIAGILGVIAKIIKNSLRRQL